MVLIGNKIDKEREVTTEEGQKFADSNNMPFYETSAKEGINVNECIKSLINQSYDFAYSQSQLKSAKFTINMNKRDQKNKKDSKCC